MPRLSLAAPLLLAVAVTAATKLPPVVVIPGFPSSNLQVTFGPQPPTELGCPSNFSAMLYPPSSELLNRTGPACIAACLAVYYNYTTSTYLSLPDVTIDILDFGGFDQMNFDPSYLEHYGYVVGQTLFGAPFDWRYAADGLFPFYDRLQTLVENITVTTGQKVVVSSASDGGLVSLGFLYYVDPNWKRRHLCGNLVISPLWSGTPATLEYITQGAPFGKFPNVASRALGITWPALLWNMPRAGTAPGLYNSSETLVYTPRRNYAAEDLPQFLADVGFPDAVPLFNRMSKVASDPFTDPGIDTWVAYGYGVNTSIAYKYNASLTGNPLKVPPQPVPVVGDGDSLVPVLSSLRAKYAWAASMAAKKLQFHYNGYQGMFHANCWDNSTSCLPDAMKFVLSLDCTFDA